jgi:hypothetical protein
MVSDVILAALIAGVVGLAGASIGIFAEPVRVYFARRAHREQLRRTLYGELVIKLRRVTEYYLAYESTLHYSTTRIFSVDEAAGPISFPDEVTAEEQYYQLTSQEFDLLAAAYFRLRRAVNLVNQFRGIVSPEVAKKKLKELKDSIQVAGFAINSAFKRNRHFLEEIDKGALLKDWNKLCCELMEPKWSQLQMQEYLQDCAAAAEEPTKKGKEEETVD